MRGLVTPVAICCLAALPLAFAVLRVPRKVFIGTTAVIGTAVFAAYIAFAAYDYRFTENLTTSLNGHMYIYKPAKGFKKGDLVAYRWHGGFNYQRGSIFIKRIEGEPGGVVSRKGREFFVDGRRIGVAKPKAKTGEVMEPAEAGVIGPGEYFLATPSPDSLDSRYAVTGNIKERDIIGKAYEIF